MSQYPHRPSRIPYLENLPLDIITCILSSLTGFKDLLNSIVTSPFIYGAFRLYPDQTLLQVAKNLVGEDVWKDAVTVLVYQRSKVVCRHYFAEAHAQGLSSEDYIALNRSLRSEFILLRQDIPLLVKNHRFFKRCADRERRYLRCPFRYEASPSDPASLPCSFAGALPAKYFYRMWVYSFRFGYEDIKTFARRPPLSDQEIADLYFLSRIITDTTGWGQFISPPCHWNPQMREPTRPTPRFDRDDLFTRMLELREVGYPSFLWGPRYIETLFHSKISVNPVIYLKMVHHLCYREDIGGSKSLEQLEADFVTLSTEKMIEEFGLSLGWEDSEVV